MRFPERPRARGPDRVLRAAGAGVTTPLNLPGTRMGTPASALAEKCFQRAIDLDPIFAGGYTGLAAAINRAGAMFLTRNLPEALNAEEALARRAVALDGDDAEARSRLAIALQSRGDYQGGQARCLRYLAVDENR